MTYATGWQWVDQAPHINGPGTDPLPLGPRHAVKPGTRRSLCEEARPLAHIEPTAFSTGGLGYPACRGCVAKIQNDRTT